MEHELVPGFQRIGDLNPGSVHFPVQFVGKLIIQKAVRVISV